MNKYVISMVFDYDQYSVLEHHPTETKYSKEEIVNEIERIYKLGESLKGRDYYSNCCGSKNLPILDTKLHLQDRYQLYTQINAIKVFTPPIILGLEEWFEIYK